MSCRTTNDFICAKNARRFRSTYIAHNRLNYSGIPKFMGKRFMLQQHKQRRIFENLRSESRVYKKQQLWRLSGRYQTLIWRPGALSIQEENPEISVGAKVEFPISKKLFHLVVNPGTSRCSTVDLELVQTTRNVNGTRHSVRKFQPGKRAHLLRLSTFSGNFPVGRADETCSIYPRTGNSGNFD